MAVSPDGRNVYATSVNSNAIDVFARNPSTGALTQVGSSGCIVETSLAGCTTGTQLGGADAVSVSPDGRYVYSAAFASNTISVFKRVTNAVAGGRR